VVLPHEAERPLDVYMKNEKIILFVLILLILVCCVASCAWLLGVFIADPMYREWKTKQKFHVMSGADYLFEDQGDMGGSSTEKTVYYWIDEEPDNVERYYQRYTTPFVTNSDDYGTWRMALIRDENSAKTTHYCNYRDYYDCITIALVDASQPDFYQSRAAAAGMFRRSENPPEFASLPPRGTLIVYSYFVIDW
jgi:hypothetical protein